MNKDNKDIDNLLYNYFDNNKNIPNSTQHIINNAFEKKEKSKTNIHSFKSIIRYAFIMIILSTTIVLGIGMTQNIKNKIKSPFNNSNGGIDKAAESGYIQEVEMDYIYDKDIGIKIYAITMDEHNLDIAFEYQYNGKEINNIKSIYCDDLSVKDEKENIIKAYFNDTDNSIINSMNKSADAEKIDNNIFRTSVLLSCFNGKELPDSKKLYIKINKIYVGTKSKEIEIDGEWNLSIELNEKIIRRNIEKVSIETIPYDVSECVVTQMATSMKIQVKLRNEVKDLKYITKHNNISLKDENNNIYEDEGGEIFNSNGNTFIELFFPINKENEIKDLILEIKLKENKKIKVKIK